MKSRSKSTDEIQHTKRVSSHLALPYMTSIHFFIILYFFLWLISSLISPFQISPHSFHHRNPFPVGRTWTKSRCVCGLESLYLLTALPESIVTNSRLIVCYFIPWRPNLCAPFRRAQKVLRRPRPLQRSWSDDSLALQEYRAMSLPSAHYLYMHACIQSLTFSTFTLKQTLSWWVIWETHMRQGNPWWFCTYQTECVFFTIKQSRWVDLSLPLDLIKILKIKHLIVGMIISRNYDIF